MISGSSVSTRIALASQSVHGGGHPWELQGKANLILVLEAHATAHSAAPGARLQDGLERPSHHDVDGRPRTIFGPERLSPTGDIRDLRDISRPPRDGKGCPAAYPCRPGASALHRLTIGGRHAAQGPPDGTPWTPKGCLCLRREAT